MVEVDFRELALGGDENMILGGMIGEGEEGFLSNMHATLGFGIDFTDGADEISMPLSLSA